jgi:serine/threonine protein phosphatase 1
MAGRTLAIGDIHGCATALQRLLEAIAPVADDRIIVLGDMIDRGPDSRDVLEQLLQLKRHCQVDCLLGNHEEMMLSVVVDRRSPLEWCNFGGAATLESYGFIGDISVIPAEHLELLRSAAEYVETETHFFQHANYEPHLPLKDQSAQMRRWIRLDQHLPSPHMSGKQAIVGHTPDKSGEVFQLAHLICLDTFCYGGGWLTAMDANTGELWQTNERGEYRHRAPMH